MKFLDSTPFALAAARAALACSAWLLPARSLAGPVGAEIAWVTVEAEAMRTNGTVLGPVYAPHRVEMESSGQRCVRLDRAGEYVEFSPTGAFDALVVRFHLPDAPVGGGRVTEIDLLVNDQPARRVRLSSREMWLYGNYPFSNDPAEGKPRNFYDEIRLKGLAVAAGDVVRLQKVTNDGVPCTLDLVDLERVPVPRERPAAALPVGDFGARGDGVHDDTAALRSAIVAAAKQGGVVWVPAGEYLVTGDLEIPSGVTIQGAGMWHTNFVGDATLYAQAARRVRFRLKGHDVHLADFSIQGRLNYRNDQEPNDGVVVAGCTDASVRRVWVEHTKAGVWVYNGTRLLIEGCRFRNLLADGVNFCVGTNHSVVENCTARGTGDDCYAIWPAPSDQGHDELTGKPGFNVIRRSTGQLPFLANGGSLYGGANNRIEDCMFTDITAGCGVLVSSTFPTADEAGKVDNNFSGETIVANCRLIRCGGYDHSWAWRGAVQICLDRRSIAGVVMRDVEIRDSLSDGIQIAAPGRARGHGELSRTTLENVTVDGAGLGSGLVRGLWIREDAAGVLTVRHSRLTPVVNEAAALAIQGGPP